MVKRTISIAVLLLAAAPAAHAQSANVPNNGAIGGLVPRFVDVSGVRTRYYELGTGEPMVLVHGGGFAGYYSANVWSTNIKGLATKYHVFAADKLASGMTDNPKDDKDFNIQGEVEHMYRFIQAMKLGKVHLVGQSRGAGLAWLLAIGHPEVVKTLVMVDSATASPDLNPGIHERLLAKCPPAPDENWKCEMRILSYEPNATKAFPDEYFVPAIAMAHTPKSQAAIAKMKAGAGEPLRSQFNAYKASLHDRFRKEVLLPMPTLLIWGVNDPQAPALTNGVALYEILAARHPNVRLQIVNNAGHFNFREYPDEFNHTVMAFIDYWNAPAAGSR